MEIHGHEINKIFPFFASWRLMKLLQYPLPRFPRCYWLIVVTKCNYQFLFNQKILIFSFANSGLQLEKSLEWVALYWGIEMASLQQEFLAVGLWDKAQIHWQHLYSISRIYWSKPSKSRYIRKMAAGILHIGCSPDYRNEKLPLVDLILPHEPQKWLMCGRNTSARR